RGPRRDAVSPQAPSRRGSPVALWRMYVPDSIPVIDPRTDKLLGYCALEAATLIASAGAGPDEVDDLGEGGWEEIYSLPNWRYVIVGRTWCEGIFNHPPARVLDREGLERFFIDNQICPPDDLFKSFGLSDFSGPPKDAPPPLHPRQQKILDALHGKAH